MPKFIKVTRSNNDKEQVYLNTEFIFRLTPMSDGTTVHYNDGDIGGDTIDVTESVDTILSQIEGKAYVK